MPQQPTPPGPGDSLDWRPRPQKPTQSYASFRELREQMRAQTAQHPAVGNSQPTAATRAAPTAPQAAVPKPERENKKSWWPFKRKRPKLKQPGRVIITDPTLVAVRIPADGEKRKGPTTQQRISAIVTGVVGVVAVLVLLARPWLSAQAGRMGVFASGSGSFARPTASPSYTPVQLDTDHPPPVLWASSAFVMDETNGAVLFAKNPDLELPMASTTKLMTAIVALMHGNLDQTITIGGDSANTYCTCMGLRVGEQYTLRELMYGMLLISGNDAAEAIADGVGGNVSTFVGWMNQEAAALGLNHTHFANPHGLPDNNHYSTARDLAVLGRYALSIPALQQIDQTLDYTIPHTATHARHHLLNLYQPMWWYPGADGGKPGWTPQAQFVEVLSAARNGHHIIASLVHGENDWVTDLRDLLNWGFDDFTWVSPRDIDKQHWIPYDDAYQYFNWDVPSRTLTVGNREYFPYTGYIVADTFLNYYNHNGGLTKFGFPRGMPTPNADGTYSQKFDNVTITCSTNGTCHT